MTGKLSHSPSMHLALYQAATSLAARTIRRGKLGTGLAGRRDAAARWVRWAAEHRGTGPLIWVHAASVGETLASEPVVRRLAAGHALKIVRTFSSPSAADWPYATAADAADYAPLDTRPAVQATLAALRPTALVFSRGDLWPVLVDEAERRGIPVVVIGGVVRPESRRLSWPTRALLKSLHAGVRAVGAVSAGDAERWRMLGVPAQAIQVTGDPRHDWVLERPTRLDAIRDLRAWRGAGGPVLVAGSLEPEDETALLDALRLLKNTRENLRVVVVPHEANPGTGRRLTEILAASYTTAVQWPGEPIHSGTAAVVVTARGLLADLYVLADIALVGGGFGRRGTHSVVEPAAYGVPVVFGAAGRMGADERALETSGGGVAMGSEGAGAALAATCRAWLANAGDRGRMAGLAARRTLSGGAASISAELVRRAAGLE